ncbi:cadherin repeat domain-containing protein [Vibrio sp. RC27]
MSLQLKVVSGEDVSYLKLSEIHMVYYAQPGAVYTLVDAEGNVVTEDLELRHHLDKLEIIHEDAPVAVLEDFYAPSEQPAVYAFEEVGESNVDDLQDNSAISGGDVGAEPGVVWNSEIASLNENVATTDLGLESSVVAEPVIVSDYDTSTSDDVSFSLTENTNVLYTTLGVVGAAGVAALASGGGSGGGDSGSPTDSGNSAASDTDTSDPLFTSGSSATAINENSGSGQVVYTAVATDDSSVTYSLSGADAGSFSINGSTGAVTLNTDPDFESKPSYSFTVTATDSEGNSSAQNVSLAVNDGDENAPSFSSGSTASVTENSGSGQVVYTAVANDDSSVTYSISGADAGSFSINGSTGAVTLNTDPDFESKPSYSFTVTATDSEGNSSNQNVNLAVNDIDDTSPVFTSSTTATAIDENSGNGQIVYTATVTDANRVTYSISGDDVDAGLLSIDSNSGRVILVGDPDFETQSSYSFTIKASDSLGNSTSQDVSLAINDVTEIDPSVVVFDLTSGESSDHSNQTFNVNESYTIYIVTDSSSTLSLGSSEQWRTAGNLGDDDEVVLIGNVDFDLGTGSSNGVATLMAWQMKSPANAYLRFDSGTFALDGFSGQLWSGVITVAPSQGYETSLPAGVSV